LIQTDLYKACLLAVFCTIFTCISLVGQKDQLQKANAAFEEDHFREALIYYNRIDKISNSAPILFKRGVCYYEINQLDNALEDFRRSWEFGYTNPEVDLYTGKIQHHRGQFALAAKHYKNYLKDAEKEDIRRKSVLKLLKQCGRALDLSYLRPLGVIERLPGGANTAYDEIGLIESPSTQGKYYFTSNKPNTSATLHASDYDVYWVQQEDGKWSDPKRMSYVLNRGDEDVLLGFTTRADGIYFYRGEDFEGEILLSQGVNSKAKPKTISLPSSVSLINNDMYFYNDEVVIYSSRDGDGYGGYDLYASVKKDDTWTAPVNLGPKINTPFDEVSPYLSDDGSEIYFSSDRDESIGGYDVFYSQYLYEANLWAEPVNMGIPVNSPGDDTYFQISFDGLTAMLSSDRKQNNLGGMDNYIVRFKERRSSLGYGEGQLAFLDYSIPDEQQLADAIDPSFEKSVTTDDTFVNEELDKESTKLKENTITAEGTPEVDESSTSSTTSVTTPSEGLETKTPDAALSAAESVTLDTSTPSSTAVANGTSTATVTTSSQEGDLQEIPVESASTPVEQTPVTSPISLTYEPIYYTSGQDLVTERNYDNLERIISTLKAHPDLKVDLVGHSSSEGIVEYKLFSSLKIAERLKRHLTHEGIQASRIHIKGVGDNYPMILQDEDEPKIAKYTKYNSRVEVEFSEYEAEVASLERISPEVPSFVQDQRFDLYQTLIDDAITYKISIAVVGQMYRNKALDLFNDTSVEEDKTTGLYTYTIGLYDAFADAVRVKRDMERLGITDARVIAYYDGKMLKEDEYVYYVNSFPDLRGLMNFQN